MKKTIAILSFQLITGALVSGCGDINADTPPSASAVRTKFSGAWHVTGGTKTAFPGQDENCGYGIGSGTITVEGNSIAGNLTDNSGYAYVIEGRIDEGGKMSGEFTYEGYDAATFDGVLADNNGGGTWNDINGCPGSWQAKRSAGGEKQIAERAQPSLP
ncbi:MAG: hypothetical protein ACREV4_10490 [Gammaproteobacteria bacterium]